MKLTEQALKALDRAARKAEDAGQWITTEQGNHLYVDGDGNARTGPGGKIVVNSQRQPVEELLDPDDPFIDHKKFFASGPKDPPSISRSQQKALEGGMVGKAEVKLKDMIPTQDYTGSDKVRSIANKYDDKKAEVFLINKGGKYYIHDGHHTAAAAVVAGKKTIKSYVLEL